jgi:hypothetical protein
VWGYAAAVEIRCARFVVREGGRQRVIRNRCKEVHAWVRGDTKVLADEGMDVGRLLKRWQAACVRGRALDVTYNPFYTPTFVVRTTGVPVYGAARVVIIGKRVFAAGAETSILVKGQPLPPSLQRVAGVSGADPKTEEPLQLRDELACWGVWRTK